MGRIGLPQNLRPCYSTNMELMRHLSCLGVSLVGDLALFDFSIAGGLAIKTVQKRPLCTSGMKTIMKTTAWKSSCLKRHLPDRKSEMAKLNHSLPHHRPTKEESAKPIETNPVAVKKNLHGTRDQGCLVCRSARGFVCIICLIYRFRTRH